MSKKVTGTLSLQIAAGKANPSPPVGPALGQRGVNIMEFCKAFNDKTKEMEPGSPIPVLITIYKDKSFTFVTKKPPVSYLIKKAVKLKKGCQTPGRSTVSSITRKQMEEIAEVKMEDMNADTLDAAVAMIAGSAYSMGIKVVD